MISPLESLPNMTSAKKLKVDLPCKIQDEFLKMLARGTFSLLEEDRKEAESILKEKKKAHNYKYIRAALSGALAGSATLVSAIPFGLAVAIMLGFTANYQGFINGATLGKRLAIIQDSKQDLQQRIHNFFNSLAKRLIRRYAKAHQDELCSELGQNKNDLFSADQLAKFDISKRRIQKLSKRILKNLPDITSGVNSKILSNQELIALAKPIRKACKFVGREKKSLSSLYELKNEYETKQNFLLNALQSRIHQKEKERGDRLEREVRDLRKELSEEKAKRERMEKILDLILSKNIHTINLDMEEKI